MHDRKRSIAWLSMILVLETIVCAIFLLIDKNNTWRKLFSVSFTAEVHLILKSSVLDDFWNPWFWTISRAGSDALMNAYLALLCTELMICILLLIQRLKTSRVSFVSFVFQMSSSDEAPPSPALRASRRVSHSCCPEGWGRYGYFCSLSPVG